jgi:hypothetical protein
MSRAYTTLHADKTGRLTLDSDALHKLGAIRRGQVPVLE